MYWVHNKFDGGDGMKLLRTKIWSWSNIGQLKVSVLLLGMIVGAYFNDFVIHYVWIILIAAVLLAIRPAVAYLKD